jgi:hypothetical protein
MNLNKPLKILVKRPLNMFIFFGEYSGFQLGILTFCFEKEDLLSFRCFRSRKTLLFVPMLKSLAKNSIDGP